MHLNFRVFCVFRESTDIRKLWLAIKPSLRKQPSFFAPGPSGVSQEGRLRFTAKNSILMTYVWTLKFCINYHLRKPHIFRSFITHHARKVCAQPQMSCIITYVRVALATSDVFAPVQSVLEIPAADEIQWRIETKLACQQPHLNHVARLMEE